MPRNSSTPRVFVAATRMNDGKTTTALGLVSALRQHHPRIGYIKPVGQRFVEVEEQKIDEDSVLMQRVYQIEAPLVDMSPIAVEPDFTRRYLESSNIDHLVRRIEKAFDRVAWEKDFVVCEGTGHAGVGSVFDLSNATVARLLGAKVIIVTQGGIGRPIDEVALNQALFEREGVEIIGVILNKVLPDKIDSVAKFVRKGLKRRGLNLLGTIPHQPLLSSPTLAAIREELEAELLNSTTGLNCIVDRVVVGAMSVHHAMHHFTPGALVIAPGDREDILLAAGASLNRSDTSRTLAGIILTDNIRPSAPVMKVVRDMPFPVLLAEGDSYQVAARVHDLTIKTRPADTEKIQIIRDLVSQHVDVPAILDHLKT
ncbi:MAG: AAA family ATPase [Verrucomicrobiales bacterium]|nr:AAA family ATPase [Verrucomicrobiales bacterium]